MVYHLGWIIHMFVWRIRALYVCMTLVVVLVVVGLGLHPIESVDIEHVVDVVRRVAQVGGVCNRCGLFIPA